MPRLFTGVEVPPEIAEQLSMIRGGLVGARWIDSENYHVTLRFMGDIDYGSARDVSALLGHVRRAPLTLTIDGLDIFGGDKPRALVARIAPTQQLIELPMLIGAYQMIAYVQNALRVPAGSNATQQPRKSA